MRKYYVVRFYYENNLSDNRFDELFDIIVDYVEANGLRWCGRIIYKANLSSITTEEFRKIRKFLKSIKIVKISKIKRVTINVTL